MRIVRLALAWVVLLVPGSVRAQTTAGSIQSMLWSYGDAADASSWSGGDGTYSVGLPDGRVVWLFSDTFLGPVNPDGSRSTKAGFVHNSMVVQDGSSFRTILGPDASTLIVPPDKAGFYWVGDGIVEGNELLVFVMRFVEAPIPFAFQQVGTDVARFSLPSLRFEGITRKPLAFAPGKGAIPISYGSAVMQSHGYDYIYGVADAHIGKDLYLARVKAGHVLDGAWEYWAGDAWSAIPALAASIASGVANELSVTPTASGEYALVTQQNSNGPIMLSRASSPQGPWSTMKSVFVPPESNGRLFTYNAKAHEELSSSTSLVVSYNVNSYVNADLYSNVNSYRPRFIEISL